MSVSNGEAMVHVPPGEIEVTASSPDYASRTERVTAKPHETTVVSIKLNKMMALKSFLYFKDKSDDVLTNSRICVMLDDIAEKIQTLLQRKAYLSKIIVEGHTSSDGPEKDNYDLSRRRADAVVNYLVSKGIPANNFEARGYGETRPFATNDTEEGREKNNRVEFIIVQ